MELMALNFGSEKTKVEKLATMTEPIIFVYNKTGTLSYPRVYLDGIICSNHFF
jgi:hypothetical protein